MIFTHNEYSRLCFLANVAPVCLFAHVPLRPNVVICLIKRIEDEGMH